MIFLWFLVTSGRQRGCAGAQRTGEHGGKATEGDRPAEATLGAKGSSPSRAPGRPGSLQNSLHIIIIATFFFYTRLKKYLKIC